MSTINCRKSKDRLSKGGSATNAPQQEEHIMHLHLFISRISNESTDWQCGLKIGHTNQISMLTTSRDVSITCKIPSSIENSDFRSQKGRRTSRDANRLRSSDLAHCSKTSITMSDSTRYVSATNNAMVGIPHAYIVTVSTRKSFRQQSEWTRWTSSRADRLDNSI